MLKITLFCVFGVMQCIYVVQGSKTHYFPHTVHYCCSSMPRLSETRVQIFPIFTNLIVLRSEVYSDWPAIQCVVIGQIPKVCDGNGNETKPIKPIMNEAFVAFSEDIITDSMTRTVFLRITPWPRKHNTMSAFVIVEMPNKHYSTQLQCSKQII